MPASLVVRQIGESVTIRYRDVALFSKPRARAVLARLGRVFFELAAHEIAGHISDAAPVGVSGHLAQSFSGGDPRTGGIEILGQEVETLEGRVFSSLPYAIVIDQGRRPGARMPPVDALLLWVERKFGIPRGFDDDELERTAWAVARSIQMKGIRARHFVDEGLSNAMPRVEAIFQALADAIAEALVDQGEGGSGFDGGGFARRTITSGGLGGGGLL